ncbi:hypothetical protein CI1B_23650 [Bradyrhizobium ivorense]|uniref:Uncharacterized protein n=1 Tax=Bradyrhizobium ivorense TaxID=2511166 RepID=A0A508T0F5_9BRAD|nr:hypothetical protein [Bradyrhizobium ivorense]VIO68802.1 hypothetical protein CI1B_23650 [Bradyrhizobium ivorense]
MKKLTLVSSVGLAAAIGVATSASWLTYKHDFVMRERLGAEWTALALMDEALANGRRPQAADAAAFLSNKALNGALQQLVGATVHVPAEKVGGIAATIEEIRIKPGIGLAGAAMDIRVASPSHGAAVKMHVEGDLAFRGTRLVQRAAASAQTVAEFAISIANAEPRLDWGFMDLPGRRMVGEVIASGLMLALDRHLVVEIPMENGLAFDTGFNNVSTVPTSAGSVTLKSSLPGQTVRQNFAFSMPLFVKSGVWLMGTRTAPGEVAPAKPTVPQADLPAKVAALRTKIGNEVEGLEQKHDLVLMLRGAAIVGMADQIARLPEANRTATIASIATTGQLVSDGKSYVELRDPTSATARVVMSNVAARWIPNQGAALAVNLNMDMEAKVHVHANPLPVGGGAGTTVLLKGSAGKHVDGTLRLNRIATNGHSLLVLDASVPCGGVMADVKTDGRIEVGDFKTDLFPVGLRWNVPVPQSIGQPTIVVDDLPKQFALETTHRFDDGTSFRMAHDAIEYRVSVADVQASQDGYVVSADLEVHPSDGAISRSEPEAQRAAISAALESAKHPACPAVEGDMRVTIGDIEIGPNGEIMRALRNFVHDITKGPGPSNDLVGSDGAVATTLKNAAKDLTQGPGPTNDAVGRKGWVRQRLGF